MDSNKKLSAICALYIGIRPVQVDNINFDKLYYFHKQLEYIEKYKDLLHKFYFVVTFQNDFHKNLLENELKKYETNKIKFLFKENLGGSYTSWKFGLKNDNGESDLIFLLEDDYVIYDRKSIETIVSDFDKEPNLFYYCGLWRENHAAISNGIINNKLFSESKLDFDTVDKISRNDLFNNQLNFLEPFRIESYHIKDYTDKYSSVFSNGVNNITEYGLKNGTIIFHPLTII